MTSETREIMHDIDAHPVHGTRTYYIIGGILTVLTMIEIAMYYLETWEYVARGTAAVVILVLSAAKFVLVAMFYMHLKYDSPIFTGVFAFPLALAALVIVGMYLLFHVLHGTSTAIHGTFTADYEIHGPATVPDPAGPTSPPPAIPAAPPPAPATPQ
jgi:cytochrome c oxidase subunit IV